MSRTSRTTTAARVSRRPNRPAFPPESVRTSAVHPAYDPATWRSPADALATRFYDWRPDGVHARSRHHRCRGAGPRGIGVKNFWSLLSEGRTATRRVTFFDPSPFRSQVAAEIDFDPELFGLSPQEIRRMDRSAQLAAVATQEAITDSVWTSRPSTPTGPVSRWAVRSARPWPGPGVPDRQ